MTVRDFSLTWGMLILGVLMNAFGFYAVKVKMNTLGDIQYHSVGAFLGYFISLAKNPMAFFGIIALFAAMLPYAVAISKMPLSIAYPASIAMNCVILIPLSTLFLGEILTVKQIAAIILIIFSVYLLYK